jgi:ABC-type oligopeptide transport system substrate-binding subunit
MVRRQLLAVMLAAVAAIVIAQPGSSTRGQEGGILRVSFSPAAGLDYIDPALSFTQAGWLLLETTCARLYTYPDTASPRSYRPQPEVAATYSRSKNLKTYTFRLRTGFRFSNGAPVRASAFAHAINRALQPSVDSPGQVFVRDIVGAEAVLSNKTTTARGVVAHGNTLVVRFKRAAPDFLARTTLPFFCAVPPGLPSPREGMGKHASAGPYYVTEYRKGDRIEIRRNPFYGGKRRVHLNGFDVNLNGGNPVELLRSIDRGDADWGHMLAGIYFGVPGLDFVKKYGLNKSQFWMKPGLTLRVLAFNSARPLFRKNPQLRRAVNFALDRQALLADGIGGAGAAKLTDQHLPRSVPGFRDASIYPFEGDLERAQQLAGGHLRDRKAVLYTSRVTIANARLIKEQLAKIGLDVTIDPSSEHVAGAEYWEQLTAPGAKWDLAFVLWTPNIPDAYAYLNLFVEGRGLGGESLTRIRSKLASAALNRAVRLPTGRARDRRYAEVDAMIARNVAPVAALNVMHEATLVSDRVDPDCMVLRPALDLAVACLRK